MITCSGGKPESSNMKRQYHLILFLGLFNLLTACNGQTNSNKTVRPLAGNTGVVGGGCEGCELMYVAMPTEIHAVHESLGWTAGNQKLIVTGKIFQSDGRTPAASVTVYYWHTNEQGLYASDDSTPEEARIHGRLRGWVKSDDNGNYTIKTSRPAAYPNDRIPQHIHLSIREPDITNEYFADLYFEGDPLYPAHQKQYGRLDRAGAELLKVLRDGKTEIARHNIILGLNIPNYPHKK